MRFRHLRYLGGPNRWAPCPVFEAGLDFSEVTSWSAERIQNTVERLDTELFGGPPDALGQGADENYASGIPRDLATAYVQSALRLHNLVADRISFGAVRQSSNPNLFLTAVQFATEELGRAVMEGALTILKAAATENQLPLTDLRDQLLDLFYEQFPARKTSYRNLAATLDIVIAARKRNIPTAQINPTYWGSLRLGQGSKHRRPEGVGTRHC